MSHFGLGLLRYTWATTPTPISTASTTLHKQEHRIDYSSCIQSTLPTSLTCKWRTMLSKPRGRSTHFCGTCEDVLMEFWLMQLPIKVVVVQLEFLWVDAAHISVLHSGLNLTVWQNLITFTTPPLIFVPCLWVVPFKGLVCFEVKYEKNAKDSKNWMMWSLWVRYLLIITTRAR